MSHAANNSSGTDSLATPQPLEEDDTTAAHPASESLSEMLCSLKALVLLSLGLKNGNNTPTFDLAILPWSAALCPITLKMTAKDIPSEVTWSSVAIENVLSMSCSGQWTVSKATEWLNKIQLLLHTRLHSSTLPLHIKSQL